MDDEEQPKKPTHDVLAAREGKNGRTYYYRIGAAFEHEDKQGFTADTVASPNNGRFILRSVEERIAEAKKEKAPAREPRRERER